MKKRLLYALLILALIIGIITFAYYQFGERTFLVKRTIQISTPSGFAFKNMSTFENILRWNPIILVDPQVQTKILGNDGYEGGILVWEGPKIGKGEEKIIGIGPFHFFETKIKLFEPYQMEGISSIQMGFQAGTNDIIWGIQGTNTPLTTLKLLLQGKSLKKILGDRIQLGLEKFQKVTEQDYLDYLRQQEENPQPLVPMKEEDMNIIQLK